MSKIHDIDLYALLGISIDATEKEVVKAYRKKALKCHPDKNPDNPKAADEFHQLSKALEVLSDAAARAAYDKALKAKKAAEVRRRELDSKRRKLKDDLDSREKAAQDQRETAFQVSKNLDNEIERLRKEGSRLVEEEQARLVEELKQERLRAEAEAATAVPPRLKVKWKAKKGDPENGGYSQDLLHRAFAKYGPLAAILVSSKKCGSAVVEFQFAHDALRAVQLEIGLPANPLTLSWISGQPDDTSRPGVSSIHTETGSTGSTDACLKRSNQQAFDVAAPDENHDFESLVFRRMRQAEERKRLIEQLQAEDEDT